MPLPIETLGLSDTVQNPQSRCGRYAAARMLKSREEDLRGTVVLLFQPGATPARPLQLPAPDVAIDLGTCCDESMAGCAIEMYKGGHTVLGLLVAATASCGSKSFQLCLHDRATIIRLF